MIENTPPLLLLGSLLPLRNNQQHNPAYRGGIPLCTGAAYCYIQPASAFDSTIESLVFRGAPALNANVSLVLRPADPKRIQHRRQLDWRHPRAPPDVLQ